MYWFPIRNPWDTKPWVSQLLMSGKGGTWQSSLPAEGRGFAFLPAQVEFKPGSSVEGLVPVCPESPVNPCQKTAQTDFWLNGSLSHCSVWKFWSEMGVIMDRTALLSSVPTSLEFGFRTADCRFPQHLRLPREQFRFQQAFSVRHRPAFSWHRYVQYQKGVSRLAEPQISPQSWTEEDLLLHPSATLPELGSTL